MSIERLDVSWLLAITRDKIIIIDCHMNLEYKRGRVAIVSYENPYHTTH